MEINKVNGGNSFYFCNIRIDEEEKKIIKKLMQYGITPTFNKSADKAKLHEIELREAKKENCVTNKFLTLTKGEQEKIQEKKKEKRKEISPEKYPNSEKAQKILGEQIYLAIQMKKKDKKKIL